jgi:hypothetical protein
VCLRAPLLREPSVRRDAGAAICRSTKPWPAARRLLQQRKWCAVTCVGAPAARVGGPYCVGAPAAHVAPLRIRVLAGAWSAVLVRLRVRVLMCVHVRVRASVGARMTGSWSRRRSARGAGTAGTPCTPAQTAPPVNSLSLSLTHSLTHTHARTRAHTHLLHLIAYLPLTAPLSHFPPLAILPHASSSTAIVLRPT